MTDHATDACCLRVPGACSEGRALMSLFLGKAQTVQHRNSPSPSMRTENKHEYL